MWPLFSGDHRLRFNRTCSRITALLADTKMNIPRSFAEAADVIFPPIRKDRISSVPLSSIATRFAA